MDRPLAAFDIETIPDPELGRRLQGFSGNDDVVIELMLRRRLEETDGASDFHKSPYHRIVTIAVAWLDPSSGKFKLGVPGDDTNNEKELLESFFHVIEKNKNAPRLISWNGNGFDLPVIRYRSMIHGISAPRFYKEDENFKWNNYQNRFHSLHVDLMDVLAGYGASQPVSLDDVSRILGLPGKTVTQGSKVYSHILKGEESLVREYCELDCLNTLLIYLVWSVHRGKLNPQELSGYVTTITQHLESNPEKKAWMEYAEALKDWPRW